MLDTVFHKKAFLLDFSTQVHTLFFTRYCAYDFTHNTIACQNFFQFCISFVFMKHSLHELTSSILMSLFSFSFMTGTHSSKNPRIMIFWTFDLLHPWHQYYIREAQKYGKDIIAIVARDNRVRERKWQAPHNNEMTRLKQLQNEFPDIQAELWDEHDIFVPLHHHEPDILILWYDQYAPENLLLEKFPNLMFFRVWAYKPEIYKSSLLRKKIPADKNEKSGTDGGLV